MSTLINLVQDLANGGITVVDLTETLREDYPVIALPPDFQPAWSFKKEVVSQYNDCLLYTSPSPRDRQKSRMPSSA